MLETLILKQKLRPLTLILGARKGNIALITALLLPCLILIGGGAIELTIVNADQKRSQDVADAAALMGATQLTTASNGVLARSQAFALAQLGDLKSRSEVQVTADQPTPSQVEVTVTTHRASFFGNMLPPGGFTTHATSVATATSTSPLCVLGIAASTSNDDVHTTSSSMLNAGSCLVHANRNIQADGGTSVQAATAEASGGAAGAIVSAPQTGAPTIADPFAALNLTPPATCNAESSSAGNGQVVTLQPGLHCAALSISNKGSIILAPGEHWIKAGISLGNKGTLDGTQGATLIFMSGSTMSMSGNDAKSLSILRDRRRALSPASF